MDLLCARCVWVKGAKDPRVNAAVTIYEGNALCHLHLRQRKAEKREEGNDPWTA